MILLVCINVRKEKKGNHVINKYYIIYVKSMIYKTIHLVSLLFYLSDIMHDSNAVMMVYSLNIFENSDLWRYKIKEEEQK
jgi:hypothetical protein